MAYTTSVSHPTPWWTVILATFACSRTIAPSVVRTDAHASAPVDSSIAATRESAVPLPSTTAPIAGAPPSADFQLVKEFACIEAYLYGLPDKTFVSCGQELFVLEQDELRSDPAYQRGIEREEPDFLWLIESMAGNWPDAAWLGTNRTTRSAAYGEFFHWNGERWKKIGDGKQRNEALWDVLPWTEQRAVALVQPPNGFGARLIPLDKRPFAVPRFTRPALPHEQCATRLQVAATAVLGPGDVMFGGQTCDVERNRGVKDVAYPGIGVERLQAGMPLGEFSLLEGLPEVPLKSGWEVTALVAIGPSEVLLAANALVNQTRTLGYFARWQGTTFVEQALPFDGVVNKLWLEKPDVLWATDLEDQLWRGHAGRWVRVPWTRPGGEDTEITQVWVRAPNDLWLLTRRKSVQMSAIYHGRWAAGE